MRFVFALLLLSLSCPAQDKPNILLILADDLGWSDLGCYGSPWKNTPALDKLASEGVRFSHAYTAQPICSPARAALMTGRSPARLHLTDFIPGRRILPSQRMLVPVMRQELPLEEETMPELLKKNGYATGIFGKWHLGGQGFGPKAQGFDEYFPGDANTTPSATEGGKGEYALTAKACGWIEQQKDRPFFCYLAHNIPHIPLGAKKELEDKYRRTGAVNPTYAAMMESMDDTVRIAMDKLDALGLKEKTIVIFLSDNGGLNIVEGVNTPATTNKPLRGGKGGLYEGGLRIPLIVRWPAKVPAGRVESTPVISTDILPTLLAATGTAPSPQPSDGASLLPLLRNSRKPDRAGFFWHYPHYSNQRGFPGGAIRQGDWKLIESFDDGHMELYNLAEDPSETQNLALSHPGQVADLLSALRTWRKEMDAQPMRGPNPDYDPLATWNQIIQKPGGGPLQLPASLAEVHGTMLRYEPLPHKNTLGFWVRAGDWAAWDVQIAKAGEFRVTVRYGCGNGSGGSEVDFSIAGQTLPFTVQETGGFQNWQEVELGKVTLPAGRQTLTIRPKVKKGAAVMDVQLVTITPI